MAAISKYWQAFRVFMVWNVLFSGMALQWAVAHPMPNSMVLMQVHRSSIQAELQLPLNELEAAFGHDVNTHPEGLIERLGPQLRAYLQAHIRPLTSDNRPWTLTVGELALQQTKNPINGTYNELIAHVTMTPPPGANTRQFLFRYDAIIHQVVTHRILVSIRQDWERGLTTEQPPVQLGVIELDIPTETVRPLAVKLEEGSWLTGLLAMIRLGRQHILEGTDHLLFLLMLLLPAPLLVQRKRWATFGSVRYSIVNLLKIITAFTVGHSLTLLAGALGLIHVPVQPIEILIAVSIFVSAIHAWRPLFPGREVGVAGGFGLIHGLAFASTLLDLNLETSHLVLSILGFNLGIELMQLLIMALFIPLLIRVSRTNAYSLFRTSGALLGGVAALYWMAERMGVM